MGPIVYFTKLLIMDYNGATVDIMESIPKYKSTVTHRCIYKYFLEIKGLPEKDFLFHIPNNYEDYIQLK